MSQSLYLEEWYRREKRRLFAEMKEKREKVEHKVKRQTRKMKRKNPRSIDEHAKQKKLEGKDH